MALEVILLANRCNLLLRICQASNFSAKGGDIRTRAVGHLQLVLLSACAIHACRFAPTVFLAVAKLKNLGEAACSVMKIPIVGKELSI